MLELNDPSLKKIADLVYSRFDFGVKYQAGKSLMRDCFDSPSIKLYSDHLESWNSFHEDYPQKNCFNDFISSYVDILKGLARVLISLYPSLQ